MVKVKKSVNGKPLPCEIYFDGYHKQYMDEGNTLVKKNWDFITIVVGFEGSGKSRFCMTSSLYMDSKFSLENIVFTPSEFLEAVDTLPNESVIMWDEADALGNHHADTVKNLVMNKMQRIRDKNLKIFLVSPTMWMWGWYFVKHRTRGLFEIYAKGLQRGYFNFWDRDDKQRLFDKGKRKKSYKAHKPTRYGRFVDIPDNFPVSIDEYRKKKAEATKSLTDNLKDPRTLKMKVRRKALPKLRKHFNQTELADIFDVSVSLISRDFKALDEQKFVSVD